ncbi:MAG: hypothetical protein WA432_03620 [Candidatus Babeliaceae bacterium]
MLYKKYFFILIAGLFLSCFKGTCLPILERDFKESLNEIKTASDWCHVLNNHRQHLKDDIYQLIQEKRFNDLYPIKELLITYKKEIAATKNKILSSLRYAIFNKFDQYNVALVGSIGIALGISTVVLQLTDLYCALTMPLPPTEVYDFPLLNKPGLLFTAASLGVTYAAYKIIQYQDKTKIDFEKLDDIMQLIDELLQYIEVQKALITR